MSETKVTVREAADAASLIRFALRKRLLAETNEDYRRLCDLYRDEPRFAQLVTAVADGLELRILGVTAFGLTVTPAEGSVFAARTGDYRSGLTPELRVLHGLAHLGVAAYCFSTTASLADSRTIEVIPAKVVAELTEAAEQLADSAPDDVPVDSEELREAWRAWLALPPANPGAKGELANKSRLWFVQQAVRWLEDQQLLVANGGGVAHHRAVPPARQGHRR